MTDRSKQPAAMALKIEQLEAWLKAEKDAHQKTFAHYSDTLYELVDLKLKLKRIAEAMQS